MNTEHEHDFNKFWSSDHKTHANTYSLVLLKARLKKVLTLKVTQAKLPRVNSVTQVSWEIHMKISHEIPMNFTFTTRYSIHLQNFHGKLIFTHSHFACVGSLYAMVFKLDGFRSNWMRSTLHTPVSLSQTSACWWQLQGTTDPITTIGCEISVVMLCFRR